MQNDIEFGTEPHTLHRREGPDTSVEAAYSVDTTKLEQLVYTTIRDQPNGATQDDVLKALAHMDLPYSSITARFSGLRNKKLIERTGEKRKGRSGRSQHVHRVVPVQTELPI